MFFSSIVSVIDRGILTLVVDPIRADLGIGDVDMSLLLGLSFGIFYALVGIPLGLSADRLSRRKLLMTGVGLWSIATFLGGLSQDYWHLFASRLLVGLGEATLAPCAVSMIADMFPANRRALPVSIYLMGQSVAGGLSLALTGAVLSAVPAGQLDWIPGIASLAPWRVALVLAGCLGVPVVAMIASIREPERRSLPDKDSQSFAATARFLARRWTTFAPFYAGFALLVMMAYSSAAWGATFIMRRFAISAGNLGQMQGSLSMVLGLAGALSAGILYDVVARRAGSRRKLLVLALIAALMAPLSCIVLAPSALAAVVMIALGGLLMPMIGTGMVTTLQDMLPGRMHGVGVSLFGLFNTMTGQALAPWLVAVVAGGLAAGEGGAAIGPALGLVGVPAALGACALFLTTYRAARLPADPRGVAQS
nr:MFS transporter [Novosphingobium profundi]